MPNRKVVVARTFPLLRCIWAAQFSVFIIFFFFLFFFLSLILGSASLFRKILSGHTRVLSGDLLGNAIYFVRIADGFAAAARGPSVVQELKS